MDQGKIGTRYAKSLLDTGKEKSILDTLYKEMQEIYSLSSSNEEFKFFIHNPLLKPSEKLIIADKLFAGKVNELTLAFIKMTIQNGRENYLGEICLAFIDLYRKEKNIRSAVITTASNIDDKLEKQITELIKKQFNSDVELEKKTDKNIIGGFILKIDDLLYDSSISSKLRQLKRSLQSTSQNN